jgi:hypothetical protein
LIFKDLNELIKFQIKIKQKTKCPSTNALNAEKKLHQQPFKKDFSVQVVVQRFSTNLENTQQKSKLFNAVKFINLYNS